MQRTDYILMFIAMIFTVLVVTDVIQITYIP